MLRNILVCFFPPKRQMANDIRKIRIPPFDDVDPLLINFFLMIVMKLV